MSIQDEIKRAIDAHGLWKARLVAAIEAGKSDLVPAHVCKDDQCDFGRWLLGPSVPATARMLPDYAQCRTLHARFHATAADVLRLALAGKAAEAHAALGTNGSFATTSAALTAAMMAWMKAAEKKAA